MSSPFELATAVERLDERDHVYRSIVPAGWEQGRGAFGGLVLGTLARAMIASEPDSNRALRFLSGEIGAPVLVGETRIEVTVLRRGKNLTNLDARLVQNGDVVARASAGLSAARATSGDSISPEPPAIPPASVPVRGMIGDFIPSFTEHFEYRSTGPVPFSGSPTPVVEGYVREKVVPTRVDAPMMVALLDAYWPAIFSSETRRRAATTVAFNAQLLGDVTKLDPEVPLFHRASVVALRDGFFVEMRELWHEGVLVGMNQQTFALLT